MNLPPATLQLLARVRAVLLDMDGVLYVGDQALPGVQDLIDYLDASRRQWLCVTNNASRSSALFSQKLADMGIRVNPAHILGSAQATASYLAEQAPRVDGSRGKVIMIGEEALRSALLNEGFELTRDPYAAPYAVAGIYFNLNYPELADLTVAIRNGARFIATNPDRTLPTERGQVPGTGSIIALLIAASDTQPEFVGKPYPAMYRQAMHLLHTEPGETLMVGDRYETDIVGAVELGMPTAGVLTGISTREEFVSAAAPPDVVLADLPALLAAFQAADAG